MNDFFFDKEAGYYKRKPVPPDVLFPEALQQYLLSVDDEKVVYKFPFYMQYRPPVQEVLDQYRLTVDAELWADPERDYCVTFYYY